MRKAICDFCVSESPADLPNEEVLPINVSIPKGWLEWRMTTGHGVNATGNSRLMCPLCCETRNIDVKPYSAPTLSDVLLEELYDGIRDICSDAIGDAQ